MATGSPMNAQGYFFSKAVSSQQAAELLKAGSIVPPNQDFGPPLNNPARSTEGKE
jgi:hypothetical protein